MTATKETGFTLIEILIVIGIMGLLATIIAVSLLSSREKGKDAKRVTEVKQMTTALEMYMTTVGSYPISGTASTSIPGLVPNYLSKIPVSPDPPGTGCSDAENDYMYRSVDGSSYSISFCIGGTVGTYTPGLYAITADGMKGKYDLNGDGVFDSLDPAYIAQFVVGIVSSCPLELCDISNNGSIHSYDAALLSQILANQ